MAHRLRLWTRAASSSARAQVSPARARKTNLQGLGPVRFYENVDVEAKSDTEFVVTVDKKAIRTPQGRKLIVPSNGLAHALACEWDTQKGRIRPSSMPLATLCTTALDMDPESRLRVKNSILGYLDTDTVCVRPDYPSELVADQDTALEPVMKFYVEKGVELNVTRGSLSSAQGAEAKEFVENLVGSKSCAFTLAGLDSASATAKSVLLAGALHGGAVDGLQAAAAARSEERWQARVWGLVEGGHDLDDADTEVRLCAVDVLFRFIEEDKSRFEETHGKSGELL